MARAVTPSTAAFTIDRNGAISLAPFCLARCCEAFHMSHQHLDWLETEPENVPDGQFVKDMLLELDPAVAREKHRGWGFAGWEPDEGERYFTCKHWDSATRLCTVYEQRPKMCRDHPCGACKFGCGLAG